MTTPAPIDYDNLPEPTRLHIAIIDRLEKGQSIQGMAVELAKGDKAKARRYREKLRRMLAKDPILKRAIMERSRDTLVAGLPGAMQAAVKRSHRGRMDAVRFVSESTGFHNPKVKHEHSGEVKITVNVPRPKFADTESVADDMAIEDADVVES